MFNFSLKKTAGLLILFAVVLSGTAYSQSEEATSKTDVKTSEQPEVHHELIKYEKNYTLEQDKNNESMSSTFTGIQQATPDNVYLASLTPDVDLSKIDTNDYSHLEGDLNGSLDEGSPRFFNPNSGGGSGSLNISGGTCNTGFGINY